MDKHKGRVILGALNRIDYVDIMIFLIFKTDTKIFFVVMLLKITNPEVQCFVTFKIVPKRIYDCLSCIVCFTLKSSLLDEDNANVFQFQVYMAVFST